MLLEAGLLDGSCMTVTGKTLAENVKDLPRLKPGQEIMVSQGRWVSRNDVGYLVDLKGKRMQIPSPDWDDKQVELIKLYNSLFSLR